MTEQDKNVLRRLYPELLDEELEEVEETLTKYTALLVRMVERRHAGEKESNDGNGVN